MSKKVWVKESVTLVNALGLHARAAASFTKCAAGFKADIKVCKDKVEVNGKSIMGLLLLAMPVGESFDIKASGEDAEIAIDALKGLISNKFGEA
jgi:phosphocarrier protein